MKSKFSVLKKIYKNFFYFFLTDRLFIYLINKKSNFIIKIILKFLLLSKLSNTLIKNGLVIKEITHQEISNLFILRNVKCEVIKSSSKDLIPYLEKHLINNGSLNVNKSFHYDLFKYFISGKNTQNNEFKSHSYYKWHKSLHDDKMNVRDEQWIKNKINSCKEIFFSIKKNSFIDTDWSNLPIILDQTLISSRYNYEYSIKGKEIFDGHHRVACLAALDYKKVKCIICKDIAIKTPFGILLNEINN